MRSLTTVAILSLLLFAQTGLAQLPPAQAPTPVYTVVVDGAPPTFSGLAAANATSSAAFRVTLTLANVVCSEAVTIPVTITTDAAGAPPYFSVVPEPSVINISIAQGPHVSPATGSGDSTAKATITGNITTNASVGVVVTASAPAPAECQGAGSVGAATSEPVTIFANMTAEPTPPPPEPTPEDTPFVGVFALAAVAAAVALARRRKA